MTQRTRSRNAGLIDSSIAESVPLPVLIPWISGRFYSTSIHTTTLSATALSTTAYLTAIVVPHPVTVTAIGVEVTVAGGAGSLARLAIYNDRDGGPYDLVLDAGTLAVDSTGFLSIVISQVLRAGPYWIGFANKSVTSNPTYRTYQSTFIFALSLANLMNASGGGATHIALSTNPASGGIVDAGWMRKAPIFESQTILTAAASPRVLLGV